jgi:hypothetical protein
MIYYLLKIIVLYKWTKNIFNSIKISVWMKKLYIRCHMIILSKKIKILTFIYLIKENKINKELIIVFIINIIEIYFFQEYMNS